MPAGVGVPQQRPGVGVQGGGVGPEDLPDSRVAFDGGSDLDEAVRSGDGEQALLFVGGGFPGRALD
ncbi:hypothetical protein GCM10017556_24330 [Micromonospora sagamiensis]|nr:hypothetical protein GCM10017556_24330 [Micromonospora sagamiensis]